MPGRVEDKVWQQQQPRMPVNEIPTELGKPFTPTNPPPHPQMEPNRDWAYGEH